jgi:hypothetical protein
MKTGRTGVAATVILMLAAAPVSLCIAQAPTQPSAEPPSGPSVEVRVPFHDRNIDKIKQALQLNWAQLWLWAPMEAQLRTAFSARQKMRGSAFQPFYASLTDKQKDVASVILRPVVGEPWPSAGYRVEDGADKRGIYRTLMHGTILRGAQRVLDERRGPVDDTVPTTYYYPGSPMGRMIAKRREILAAQGEKGRYGIVGLWTGSIGCHKQEGEAWRFFESDPAAIKIASDPKNFTFISKCQPDIDIAVGEPRLTLEKEPDSSFDLLIIDNLYTGEGIQAHMLTKEALELYLSKLKPDGVVLLHTSSRHIDLTSVLGANLKILPAGTAGIVVMDREANGGYDQSLTENVIFAKSARTLEFYRSSLKEVSELGDRGLFAWSDDYADIWSAWRER